MAREGCNLDKDEAEIFKPPSSSSSSAAPPPTPQSALFLKATPDLAIHRSELPRMQEADSLVVRIPAVSPSELGCKRKAAEAEEEGCPPPARSTNRCSTCRRKVRLTGFRCRCGDLFCALHRYADAHGCSYDYKAAGREEIARNNPVVRAAKIIRI